MAFFHQCEFLMSRILSASIAGCVLLFGAGGLEAGWNGCQVGVNAGFAGLDQTVKKTSVFAMPLPTGASSGGLAGGVEAGCDVSLPTFLIGVGASYDFADVTSKKTSTYHLAVIGNTIDRTLSIESRAKAVAAVSGRIGMPIGPFLIFARGGFAVTRADANYHSLFTATRFASSEENTLSGRKTRQGYLVGGGVEYEVTPAFSIKLEYNRYDFGACDCVVSGQQVSKGMGQVYTRAYTTSFSDHLATDTLKAGAFYRF